MASERPERKRDSVAFVYEDDDVLGGFLVNALRDETSLRVVSFESIDTLREVAVSLRPSVICAFRRMCPPVSRCKVPGRFGARCPHPGLT